MVLNKRIPREFKENITKYIGLILLILLSSMAIVGFSNSADCIIQTGAEIAVTNNLEDGEFQVQSKLDNFTIRTITKLGVTLDENFYIDYPFNGKTIRLFKERKNLNKISIINGNNFSDALCNEVILDEHFACTNNYSIGKTLTLNNSEYTISGYGAAPDYSFIVNKITDTIPEPANFGIGFISSDNFDSFNNNIVYCYSYKLNGFSAEKLKNIISKNSSLTFFIESKDNQRITSYIEDNIINKNMGVAIGIVLVTMIAFIISTSVINTIDKESPIIGTFYSLGYTKIELLVHFMILPVILTSAGAILGTILGFLLARPLIASSTEYYSLPYIPTVYTPSLLFIGIFLPIIIVIVINTYTLYNRLNSTPLQLLRNEKKQGKMSSLKIKHLNFITKFRIRQFLREYTSNLILFFGIIISTFLLVFGLGCNSAISTYLKNIADETNFKYTYILNLPINIPESDEIEKTTITNLSIYYDTLGQNIDLTFQGIKENSKFYNFNLKTSDPGLYISSNVRDKFGLSTGDTITLQDKSENKIYKLKIAGILDYSTGLYIFMNNENMNTLIGKSKNYFNSYITNKKLNIDDSYITSLITSDSIVDSGKNMTSSMNAIIGLVIVFASVMFIITMYLLLKLMIDKNTYSISLVKILGYRTKEINKLYLGSSFYVVLISSLIAVPLCTKLTEILWPNLISNLQTYIPIVLTLKDYIFMYIIIFASYYVSLYFLKKHLYSISMTEALKNRD